jgi:hypothetical protein
MDLVVVDGPNVFNCVASKLTGGPTEGSLRSYLADWFDLDRFVLATIGVDADPALGVVIFHSRKPLGRDKYRFDDSDEFWGRQGANPNSSCVLVDFPGSQTETYAFACSNCGVDNQAVTRSEKGLDTTITTYLLETSGRYNSVCIFSKDIDFVPPVMSLRRHGKRVFCATEETTPATALVRACQSHFALNHDFSQLDLALFRLFSPHGALDSICKRLATEEAAKKFKVWLISHQERAFMRSAVHFEIGISHAEGAEGRLHSLLAPYLQAVPDLADLAQWEQRNPTLLILKFSGADILFEGVTRHWQAVAARAEWPRSIGTIKDLLIGT